MILIISMLGSDSVEEILKVINIGGFALKVATEKGNGLWKICSRTMS